MTVTFQSITFVVYLAQLIITGVGERAVYNLTTPKFHICFRLVSVIRFLLSWFVLPATALESQSMGDPAFLVSHVEVAWAETTALLNFLLPSTASSVFLLQLKAIHVILSLLMLPLLLIPCQYHLHISCSNTIITISMSTTTSSNKKKLQLHHQHHQQHHLQRSSPIATTSPV